MEMNDFNDFEEFKAEKSGEYYSRLAEAAKTDQDAFSELYDYYFPRVYNYLYGKLKNSDQADDCVSVVFEKMFTKLYEYDSSRGAFSTWLFRIASNEINNLFRQSSHKHETSWDEYFDPADERQTPEQAYLTNEGAKYLLLAMDKLPERERQIVTLKYMTGLSNREIAEQLGLTASNVGVLLHRTMDKLKKLLLAEGYNPDE